MREKARERNRGRGRENSRVSFYERPRGKPYSVFDENRYGQHHLAAMREVFGGGQRKSWRAATDVSTFYFTRFPDDMTEKDLWYVFKRWGDVREVFIPKHRNKLGRRFGFVRFKGVEDVGGKLEKQLDNMIVGGVKMFVNLPKHAREPRSYPPLSDQMNRGMPANLRDDNGKGKAKVIEDPMAQAGASQHHPVRFQEGNPSYAQVVKTGTQPRYRRRPRFSNRAMLRPS